MNVRKSPACAGWCVLLVTFVLWSPSRGFTQCCPPVITAQPTNQTVFLGTNVSMVANVFSSTAIICQWKVNGINVPGATTTNLIIPAVQYTNVGTYTLYITNSAGFAISSNAVLAVNGPPSISSQPGSTARTEGQTATFSVTALGPTPLAYQWRDSKDNNMPFATNSTLNIPNVQLWQGGRYSVVITNSYGSVTSSSGSSLTVLLNPGMIGGWGLTTNGECTLPPAPLAGFRAVAAGGMHSLGLRTNGTVVGWGDNSFNQSLVPGGINDAMGIAAGYYHSLVLRSNGLVLGWGNNTNGQAMPPPSLANVASIAAGALHSVALLNDGNVVAWGANNFGQTNVPSRLSDVIRIAAGYYHTIAVTRDGTVTCWGRTNSGETLPPAGLNGVVSVAAGDGFSLALRTNGAIVAWGTNNFGQTNIPAFLTNNLNTVAIAAGGAHALALIKNGGGSGGVLMAWGLNSVGQTNDLGLTTLTGMAGGAFHTLALKGDAAPVILSQPVDQRAYIGATVGFNAMVIGGAPMSYQWRFEGTPIPGATTNNLIKSNVQLTNSGSYTLTITNTLGQATTIPVSLTVVPPPIALSILNSTPVGTVVRVTAPAGAYVIQISPNLVNWTNVLTTNVPPAGVLDILDPGTAPVGRRFYRAHLP